MTWRSAQKVRVVPIEKQLAPVLHTFVPEQILFYGKVVGDLAKQLQRTTWLAGDITASPTSP
jgi:hypothetical protein